MLEAGPTGPYTVTLDPDGGTFDSNVVNPIITNDGKLTLPVASECTKDGFELYFWQDTNETTYTPGQEATFTEDTTLKAQWFKNITVHFDPNADDVTGIMNDQVISVNSQNLNDNNFGITNGEFKGWNTSKTGGGMAFENGAVVDTNDLPDKITLYAQWGRDITVTYQANGGKGFASDTVSAGEEYPIRDGKDFTRDPYAFVTWNTKPDGSGETYAPGSKKTFANDAEDVELYAQWKYGMTISFDANGGEGIVPDAMEGEVGVLLTVPANTLTREGYTANGWNTSPDGGVETHYETSIPAAIMSADIAEAGIKLYAEWEKKTAVTIEIEGNGKVLRNGEEVSGTEYPGEEDTTVTYTFEPAEGYALKSVNGSIENVKDCSTELMVNLKQDNALKVVFDKVSVEPENGAVDEDKIAELERIAESGGFDKNKMSIADVTPRWEGGAALSEGERGENLKFTFTLDYPANVTDKTKASDYVIQVMHYNGTEWVPVKDAKNAAEDESSFTTGSEGIIITANAADFSPYAAMAKNKYVTLKFCLAGTGESLAAWVADAKVENGAAYKMPDASNYASTVGKAFSGWSEKKEGTAPLLSRGTEIYPKGGEATEIKYFAVLEDGAAITFVCNETSETKTIIVPRGQKQDLPECPFTYAGHTFAGWKETVDGKDYTYNDRASFTTSSDRTLVAQWKSGPQPAAPDKLEVTKSILNLGYTALEDQKGVISGTQSTMEVYAGGGKWKAVTNGTYEVSTPGNYEFRYKENTPELASESAFASVHSYYTESSDPQATSDYDGKKAYKYTVDLIEKDSNGATTKVSNTVLNEVVSFMLKYPTGIDGTKYDFKIYHLSDYAEVTDYKTTTGGIIAKYNNFSDFLLVVDNNLPITFKGNGGKTSTGKTEYVQYVKKTEDAVLGKNQFLYSGYLFNGWQAEGTGKTYADQGTIVEADLSKPINLYAKWLEVAIRDTTTPSNTIAYVGDTITAYLLDSNGKAVNDSTVTYQWYARSSMGAKMKLSGETSKTLTRATIPTSTTGIKTPYVYCIATKDGNEAASNIIELKDSLVDVKWKQDLVDVIDGKAATKYAQPGQIQGVSKDMEYSTDGGSTWSKVTNVSDAGVMTILNPGIYQFRIAGTTIESDPIYMDRWFTLSYSTSSGTSYSSTAYSSSPTISGSGTARMLSDGKTMPVLTTTTSANPNIKR